MELLGRQQIKKWLLLFCVISSFIIVFSPITYALTLSWSLDKSQYVTGTGGRVQNIQITNSKSNQIKVTAVGFTADWMESGTWYSSNADNTLATGQTGTLPIVTFYVKDGINTGDHNYQIGVRYQEYITESYSCGFLGLSTCYRQVWADQGVEYQSPRYIKIKNSAEAGAEAAASAAQQQAAASAAQQQATTIAAQQQAAAIAAQQQAAAIAAQQQAAAIAAQQEQERQRQLQIARSGANSALSSALGAITAADTSVNNAQSAISDAKSIGADVNSAEAKLASARSTLQNAKSKHSAANSQYNAGNYNSVTTIANDAANYAHTAASEADAAATLASQAKQTVLLGKREAEEKLEKAQNIYNAIISSIDLTNNMIAQANEMKIETSSFTKELEKVTSTLIDAKAEIDKAKARHESKEYSDAKKSSSASLEITEKDLTILQNIQYNIAMATKDVVTKTQSNITALHDSTVQLLEKTKAEMTGDVYASRNNKLNSVEDTLKKASNMIGQANTYLGTKDYYNAVISYKNAYSDMESTRAVSTSISSSIAEEQAGAVSKTINFIKGIIRRVFG